MFSKILSICRQFVYVNSIVLYQEIDNGPAAVVVERI